MALAGRSFCCHSDNCTKEILAICEFAEKMHAVHIAISLANKGLLRRADLVNPFMTCSFIVIFSLSFIVIYSSLCHTQFNVSFFLIYQH